MGEFCARNETKVKYIFLILDVQGSIEILEWGEGADDWVFLFFSFLLKLFHHEGWAGSLIPRIQGGCRAPKDKAMLWRCY